MPSNVSTFWLPPGLEAREANAARMAAKEYDPNLDFGKNEKTGQWCVYLMQGTIEGARKGDLPVLGFDKIPSPDEVKKRLYDSDAVRMGKELLDQINKHNDDIHQEYRDRTTNAEGQLAEAFEWGMRKENMTPHRKIYIP